MWSLWACEPAGGGGCRMTKSRPPLGLTQAGKLFISWICIHAGNPGHSSEARTCQLSRYDIFISVDDRALNSCAACDHLRLIRLYGHHAVYCQEVWGHFVELLNQLLLKRTWRRQTTVPGGFPLPRLHSRFGLHPS